MRQEQRIRRRFFLMCLLLAAMVLGSLRAGFTGLTMGDVFRILTGGGTREENLILFDFRMMRIVLAVLVGAGISVSGTVFQTISKNPLASPDLLGVSAGAGMAVMLYTLLEPEGQGGNVFLLQVVSLGGALFTSVLIYGIAHRKGEAVSPIRMVLIGVSITAGINAADILIAVRLSPEKFHLVNTWMIGSVYGNSWKHVLALLPWILILIPAAALLGAILLLGADWIARTVIAPDEMLLGIVVSLVGAPYFLYILLGAGKKEGGAL